MPLGYTLLDEATPIPGYKTFGWATAPGADSTSPVIQVSLDDVRKMGGASYPLDEFARTMVASKRPSVVDWKSAEGALEVVGVPAWRIEWSGSVQLTPATKAPMRGVMILGMKDGLGFRLEAQDVEPKAAQSVPEGERALKSFVLTVKR